MLIKFQQSSMNSNHFYEFQIKHLINEIKENNSLYIAKYVIDRVHQINYLTTFNNFINFRNISLINE